MLEFFSALPSSSLLQNALLAGLLASVATGVVGSYVSAKRITYLAGGIAHCVLGGMGIARYIEVVHQVKWMSPFYGAIVAAILAALIIGFTSLKSRERTDTIISAIWAIGMALGVLFISATPGRPTDLTSFLFGNIMMVTPQALTFILVLDVCVLILSVAFYKQLMAICFDEEHARLRGINVEAYYILLLVITSLTVVLLVTVVGLVMVIALLSLPVAISGRFTKSLWQGMIISSLLSAFFVVAGLVISYPNDLPAGATSILIAGSSYILLSISFAIVKAIKQKSPKPD